MGLLEVPLQAPGIERECDDRVCEKVHPGALAAVPVGIADRHVKQPEFRIDRSRLPDAATVALAAYPCGSRDLPSLVLLILWDGIEVPEHLSGLRIDSQHVTAW